MLCEHPDHIKCFGIRLGCAPQLQLVRAPSEQARAITRLTDADDSANMYAVSRVAPAFII